MSARAERNEREAHTTLSKPPIDPGINQGRDQPPPDWGQALRMFKVLAVLFVLIMLAVHWMAK